MVSSCIPNEMKGVENYSFHKILLPFVLHIAQASPVHKTITATLDT